jgi:hypothetical protein
MTLKAISVVYTGMFIPECIYRYVYTGMYIPECLYRNLYEAHQLVYRREISGSQGDDNEQCCLVGCDAVHTGT